MKTDVIKTKSKIEKPKDLSKKPVNERLEQEASKRKSRSIQKTVKTDKKQ